MSKNPYVLQGHFDTSRPLMILMAGQEIAVRPDTDEYGEHFWSCYEGWLKWTEGGVISMVNLKHVLAVRQGAPTEEES